jgi:hypothetical protein
MEPSKKWTNQIRYAIDEIGYAVYYGISVMLLWGTFLLSAGIIFYQIVVFVKSGIWKSISLADLAEFEWIQINLLGVYKIFTWIPASGSLLLISVAIMFLHSYVIAERKKKFWGNL